MTAESEKSKFKPVAGPSFRLVDKSGLPFTDNRASGTEVNFDSGEHQNENPGGLTF